LKTQNFSPTKSGFSLPYCSPSCAGSPPPLFYKRLLFLFMAFLFLRFLYFLLTYTREKPPIAPARRPASPSLRPLFFFLRRRKVSSGFVSSGSFKLLARDFSVSHSFLPSLLLKRSPTLSLMFWFCGPAPWPFLPAQTPPSHVFFRTGVTRPPSPSVRVPVLSKDTPLTADFRIWVSSLP